MSTTMPNAQNITRKWYVIDAADKPLGRTAALAADLLRGKHKPIFAPHVDCGDHVIIINAEKAVSESSLSSLWLDRRHESNPLRQTDEREPRKSYDAGC